MIRNLFAATVVMGVIAAALAFTSPEVLATVAGSGSPTPTPSPNAPTPTLTPFGQTFGPSPTPAVRQGDFNCNGAIEIGDVQLILRQVAYGGAGWEGPEPCPNYGDNVPPIWGDPDCDGATTPLDVLKMLEFLADLPYTQTEPCPHIGAAFP